jgi:hypothetical protein
LTATPAKKTTPAADAAALVPRTMAALATVRARATLEQAAIVNSTVTNLAPWRRMSVVSTRAAKSRTAPSFT